MKNKVDKLEISKLETTVVDLNKLSDVVTNDVVKNTEYYVAVKKINDIKVTDTSSLILKDDFDTKIGEIEKKKNTDLDHINKILILKN